MKFNTTRALFVSGATLCLTSALIFHVGGCTSDSSSSSGSTTCTATDNTTETSSVNSNGCPIITRDTTSCQASRTAQGLSGYWLKFSCNVTLTKSGSNVIIETDSYPDRKSPYYGSSSGCYEALTVSGRAVNPNLLSNQAISMTVPYAPTAAGSTSSMPGGTIGVTLDGVSIYDNEAAPGDSIYAEVDTFDKCEGHPDSSGSYHYHIEAASISYQDDNFIGVMRDGFPVYGRYDTGSVTPSLDSAGGHTGTTVDSPSTSVYHYHTNLQTDGTDSAYFLTKGLYKGTAGSCTGC